MLRCYSMATIKQTQRRHKSNYRQHRLIYRSLTFKTVFFCVISEFVSLLVAIEYHPKRAVMKSKLWKISHHSNWPLQFWLANDENEFYVCLSVARNGRTEDNDGFSELSMAGGLQETGTGATTTTVLTTTGALCHGHVLETIWQVTGKMIRKKKQKKTIRYYKFL